MDVMTTMTIGALAQAAGVGVETVRYYERTGLLDAPPRTPSGYRKYPPETVDRLGFIKHAQRLGFSLAEVAELLTLHRDVVPCEDIKQRAAAKVATIDEKVTALLAVKDELLALVERCESVCITSCTVMLSPGSCGGEEESPS
jgi:MerR family transcriptional regulator, copper efflux regulator